MSSHDDIVPITDYGEKLVHDPNWKGVRSYRERTCVNAPFVAVFLIFVAVAIGVGSYMISRYSVFSGEQISSFQSIDYPRLYSIFYIFILPSIAGLIVWLLLARYVTGPLVYFSLVVYVLYCAALCVYFFLSGILIGGIIFVIFTVLLCVWLFFMRSKIPLAIVFLREGTHAVFQHPAMTLVLGPVLLISTLLLTSGFVVLISWIPVYTNQTENPWPVAGPSIVFFLLTFYWVHEACMGVTNVSYAHSFVQFYFFRRVSARDPSLRRPYSVFDGLFVALSKSLGCILYGALLIAIIRTVRALVNLAEARGRSEGGIAGAIIMFVACIIKCILSILEAWLRYVTRYVHIYTAMYGDDFCTGCKRVMNLFYRADAQNFINDVIVGIVVTVGVLLVPVLIGVVSAVSMNVFNNGNDIIYWAAGLLFSVLIFEHYGHMVLVAVDSLFVGYFEDMERMTTGGSLHCTPEWHKAVVEYPSAPEGVKTVPMPPPLGQTATHQGYGTDYVPQVGYAPYAPSHALPSGGTVQAPPHPDSRSSAGYPAAPGNSGYPRANATAIGYPAPSAPAGGYQSGYPSGGNVGYPVGGNVQQGAPVGYWNSQGNNIGGYPPKTV